MRGRPLCLGTTSSDGFFRHRRRTSPRPRIGVIYAALLTGMLLAALDQTIVSTALPTIAGELGGLDQLSWVVTGYMLATTVSTPLWGKLGDLIGRKVIFKARSAVLDRVDAGQDSAARCCEKGLFTRSKGLPAVAFMSALALAIIADVACDERGR